MVQAAGIKVFRSGDIAMDRNRVYKILVDGTTVGELWAGQSGFFDVAPGDHRVRAKIDFMGSNELSVSLVAGQTIELTCKGHGSFAALFNTIFRRNSYLQLRPMTAGEKDEQERLAELRKPPPPRNLGTGLA